VKGKGQDPLFDDAYIPYDDGLANWPLPLLALFSWLAPHLLFLSGGANVGSTFEYWFYSISYSAFFMVSCLDKGWCNYYCCSRVYSLFHSSLKGLVSSGKRALLYMDMGIQPSAVSGFVWLSFPSIQAILLFRAGYSWDFPIVRKMAIIILFIYL